MTLQNLFGIVALAVCAAGEGSMLWTGLRRAIQKHKARKPRPIASETYYASVGDNVWYAHLPGNACEVGSPEYNAQVAGAIRALNARLATEGKRIPEKTAIEMIHLTSGEQKTPQ
jgi:hypothetical protein